MKSIGHFLDVHFFIIVGLILFLLAIIACVNNISAIQGKTVTTQAKIVSCKIEYYDLYSMPHSSYCTPTVRFKTNSGQEIDEVISVLGFEGFLIGKGETITISYAPNHPKEALITSIERWIVAIFCASWGLLCFIIVVITNLWRLKKRKRSSS